ncbi:MAG: cytochrome c3 family protein [Planctomycetota bacterium]
MDYFDLEVLRFLNPSNLRVVPSTCGQSGQGLGTACHPGFAVDLTKAMMATTPGHLAGGGYQNGVLPDRTAIWGNMPVQDLDGDVPAGDGALASLAQVPGLLDDFPADSVAHHYSDLPRKDCARCHLWSRGDALRGEPGRHGLYRSEGCAACHMQYTNEARSESADPNIDHDEPGHPRVHTLTRTIPTLQCARCHTGGARIGLAMQGLAPLPPGAPTGPGFPGLTAEEIYGGYQVEDPAVAPADVHAEAGLACIDCHVREEAMGDGNIYGHMDQATQIECEDCHGTHLAYGTGVTEKGVAHDNIRFENGAMILRGKLDGLDHPVPQAKDFLDPTHPSYSPVAALAMNDDHLASAGKLECYTCHSAWQSNCYGCHFERDLGGTQLDLIAGEETPGRVLASARYFVSFKSFQMGRNAEGKVAPFLPGCRPFTTVRDAAGEVVLHQELPVTALGRSGLAFNPVQPHTTRPVARFCVECHRNPAALGLGTESFDLTRTHLFLLSPAPAGALHVVDRRNSSAPRGAAARAPEPEFCGSCHAAAAAEFSELSHHPVPEGAMACTSCHDVHGAPPSGLADQRMQRRCGECHRDVAGPFVYEHRADSVDGCGACHSAHGSPNRRLLIAAPVRNLCLGCHDDTPANHNLASFSPFRECVTCHTEIHGSDLDGRFFR